MFRIVRLRKIEPWAQGSVPRDQRIVCRGVTQECLWPQRAALVSLEP